MPLIYEVDIWRKLSERARAGRLNALASEEELKAIRVAISAEVVTEYYILMERPSAAAARTRLRGWLPGHP